MAGEDLNAKLLSMQQQTSSASGMGFFGNPINGGARGFTIQGKLFNVDKMICGGKPKREGFFAKLLKDAGFNQQDFASGFTQAAQGATVQQASFSDIGHGIGSAIAEPTIGPSIHHTGGGRDV